MTFVPWHAMKAQGAAKILHRTLTSVQDGEE